MVRTDFCGKDYSGSGWLGMGDANLLHRHKPFSEPQSAQSAESLGAAGLIFFFSEGVKLQGDGRTYSRLHG